MLYNINRKGGKPPYKGILCTPIHAVSRTYIIKLYVRRGRIPSYPLLQEENTTYKLTKGICYLCTNFDSPFYIVVFLGLLIIKLQLATLEL